MIKLDVYDKKILETLLINSREQVSTIAKKIRLRRENVNYKINRLVKEGLIKEFNTIINEKGLGISRYVVFLELVNLQENTEQQILEYLKDSKFMSWIGTSAGKWSLVFDIVINSDIKLDKILNELLMRFGEFIDNYVILKLQEGDYFGSKLLGVIKNSPLNPITSKKSKIDKIDLKILSLLNQDSRINLVEMSQKVKLTPNGINNRLKNLKKRGFILSYTISLDWKKLGYEWYGIQLKLTKFGEDMDKKLISYFNQHQNIVFYYKYLGGSWDYDIGVIVKDSIELRDFIDEFRKKFSNIAKISDVFLVLDETSGYKLPKGIFE